MIIMMIIDETRQEAIVQFKTIQERNRSKGRGSGGGSVINGYIDRGGSYTEDSRQITDQKRNSGESDSGDEEQETIVQFKTIQERNRSKAHDMT